MPASTLTPIQTFLVEIEFFSGDFLYGTEIYTIDACNWYRAEQQGLEMSAQSIFDNSQIPDMRRVALARAS